MKPLPFLFAAFALLVFACDDQTIRSTPKMPVVDAAGEGPAEEEEPEDPPDAAVAVDAAPPPPPPACTSTYGKSITPFFGRLDGTVRIVITPGLPKCDSDDDHVIVQLDVNEAGATTTYPVVINIESNLTPLDPSVRLGKATEPLVGPPWVEGWHTNVQLDYFGSFGLHSSSFTPKSKAELGAIITAALPKGAKVSAYMHGFDSADGGHKVHRNSGGRDGALAVLGTGTPSWFLFHFSSQAF